MRFLVGVRARRGYCLGNDTNESHRVTEKNKMKVTTENAKEFAQNVMDKRQLEDFNKWAGTNYETVDELLEAETDEKVASFFQP